MKEGVIGDVLCNVQFIVEATAGDRAPTRPREQNL